MKLKISLFFLPVLFLVASCTKQPEACFTADKTKVDISETVNFESCAKDADAINWDFGDGQTAAGSTASHAWTNPGTYIVQIRAVSKGGKKVDRYSIAITVKGYTRYLTKAVLKAFPVKKADGSNWDNATVISTTTEPDILITFKLAAGGWEQSTAIKTNITPADLPYTWNLTQSNIYLSNANWTIELRDDDSLGSSFITELMTSWAINPATDGSGGVITLTNAQGYSLELHYENRQ
jgi:PKD repeat protein